MTFEPLAQDCTNPITGKLCPAYRTGDGKSTISRCLVEEIPDQINPPEWCPMVKDIQSTAYDPKSCLEGEIGRATRIIKECDQCKKPLTGRQERFCSDTCRWRNKNKVRLTTEKAVFILAQNVLKLKPELLTRFCLNELHLRGYEVSKKGG